MPLIAIHWPLLGSLTVVWVLATLIPTLPIQRLLPDFGSEIPEPWYRPCSDLSQSFRHAAPRACVGSPARVRRPTACQTRKRLKLLAECKGTYHDEGPDTEFISIMIRSHSDSWIVHIAREGWIHKPDGDGVFHRPYRDGGVRKPKSRIR